MVGAVSTAYEMARRVTELFFKLSLAVFIFPGQLTIYSSFHSFVLLALSAMADGRPFAGHWEPGGPWQP
jgi:hypothetical protein